MGLHKLLASLPTNQAIVVGVGAGIGLSTVLFTLQRYSGEDFGGSVPKSPKTTSAEWTEASKEYAKAQNINPIRHFK
ncbi:unnamed protein product [Albugo candida]|uniref:Uncharacterized protein n=1 Tax=Albugo candida TaxID=65357 RepID=A0A024GB64_9STRA|nr:unnamed protein product [Albugo candida]|eukprot:CCI43577.1 unnamed protein product [Albugo candida]